MSIAVCELCGGYFDTDNGLEYDSQGGYDFVCDRCFEDESIECEGCGEAFLNKDETKTKCHGCLTDFYKY